MYDFQTEVFRWLKSVFASNAFDVKERNHRFLEEALELAQANECTKDEALLLVDYVFSRPVGEPEQEIGGVMITLASLAAVLEVDMDAAGFQELDRVSTPEMRAKILRKYGSAPRNSPLPGAA